ncbi:unnamed protein product, partial [Rotaria sp. Silwood2]
NYYTPYTPAPPPKIVTPPHISTNEYNMPGFQSHLAAPYTSTPTFIAYLQTVTQPISTTLSEK